MIIWLLLVWSASSPSLDPDRAFADVFSTPSACEAAFDEVKRGVTEQVNHKCVPVDVSQVGI